MKMKLVKVLVIIGQVFVLFLISFFGWFLIEMKIPGKGAICDAEQLYLFLTWCVFIFISVGMIINSSLYYMKSKWKRYRVIVILFISSLLFCSIFLRAIIMTVYYGTEKYVIEAEELVFIKIQLFENKKFFAYTYNAACELENIGTYNIIEGVLTLNYKNEKSEYLGTKYRIENDKIDCLNCEVTNDFRIKKSE